MPKRKLKPMTTDIDTARVLAEVFSDKIYLDLIITRKEKKDVKT